jgi:hypothetical protein
MPRSAQPPHYGTSQSQSVLHSQPPVAIGVNWEVPHLQINQGTLQLRVAAVVALLTHGCRRHDVLNWFVNDWGISVRSADRLLRLDREEIKTYWQIERSDLLAQLFSNLSKLQQHAWQSGQPGVALASITASTKPAGLYQSWQTRHLLLVHSASSPL